MPRIICLYVNLVDWVCIKIGRLTMYTVFVMMFVLVLSFVTRNIINIPLMWIIEMAQFIITGYYLLGGGYSMISKKTAMGSQALLVAAGGGGGGVWVLEN